MSFVNERNGWMVASDMLSENGLIWALPCVLENVRISTSGPLTFGQGDSVVLSLPDLPDAAEYRWSNGASGRTIVVRASGRYEGRVRLNGGCYGIDAVTVTATPPVERIGSAQIVCEGCNYLGFFKDSTRLYAGCGTPLTTFGTRPDPIHSFRIDRYYPDVVDIATDASGNVYIAASLDGTSRLWRYGADGSVTMLRNISQSTYEDQPRVTVDAAGNIVFAYAAFDGALQSNALHVEKIAESGNTLWTQRRGSAVATSNIPSFVGCDSLGFIYAVSRVITEDSRADIVLQKITPDGLQVWERAFTLEDRSVDRPETAFLTSGGSCTIAGTVNLVSRADSVRIVISYDASGNLRWTRQISLLPREPRMVLSDDRQGGAPVARTFAKSSSNANETSLVRLDPYGNVAWSHRPGGDTTDFVEVAAMTRISAMTTDAGGNVYIAGPTATGNRLESFRSDGQKRWSLTDQGGALPGGLAVGPNGDLFLLRASSSSNSCDLVKYRQVGGFPPLAAPSSSARWRTGLSPLTIAPNPAREEFDLRFATDAAGPISIALVDNTGREIYSVSSYYEAGDYDVRIGLQGMRLPSGIYHVTASTPERQVSTTLVLVH